MVDRRTRSATSSERRTSDSATSARRPFFPGKGKVCEAMKETQLVSIVPTCHLRKPSFCTPTCSIGSGQAWAWGTRSLAARVWAAAWASSGRASSACWTRARSSPSSAEAGAAA